MKMLLKRWERQSLNGSGSRTSIQQPMGIHVVAGVINRKRKSPENFRA
jgi:hypothetical protein